MAPVDNNHNVCFDTGKALKSKSCFYFFYNNAIFPHCATIAKNPGLIPEFLAIVA
jgi:hypothetical protein